MLEKISMKTLVFHQIRRHFSSKEKVWTIPNYITMTRIISSPAIAAAIMYDYKMIALGGCVVSVLSDCLDGYIAKTFDQKTVLGAFLDPLADKIFIGSVAIALTFKDLLPLPLVVIVIGRDISLVFGAALLRARDMPKDARYLDISNTSNFTIAPSGFSKANSGIQFLLLSLTLGNFYFGLPSLDMIEPLWWITGVTTVGTGFDYYIRSGTEKIINKEDFRI
jgi:cardiolipin synthase